MLLRNSFELFQQSRQDNAIQLVPANTAGPVLEYCCFLNNPDISGRRQTYL